MALANRLLPALAVAVPEARVAAPRRLAGGARGRRRWTLATVAEVRAALAHEGSVGVIAADAVGGGDSLRP